MEEPLAPTSFYAETSKNKRNSLLLAGLVLAIILAMVYVFALVYGSGYSSIIFVFGIILAIAYMLGTYYYGDKIVLASTNAVELKNDMPKAQYIRRVVENLAFAARLPAPRIYVIESSEMNAFATGRDPEHSSIALTTALVNNLNRTELEGVIAHEMSHVGNYDIRFATIVAVMVGLVAILAELFLRTGWRGGGGDDSKGGTAILLIIGIVLAIIAPIIVRLVQAAISRKRELLADASAAQLTRYPLGLASALKKIGGINKGNMKVSDAVSHLFFVDPTTNALDALYATHPPVVERVKLLEAM